jgi:hypothetical protein
VVSFAPYFCSVKEEGMSVSTLIDGVPLTLSDGFPVSPSRTL